MANTCMDAYKHFECGACNCLRKSSKNDNCKLLFETEISSKKVFSLPMYPSLTDDEQDIVIEELKKIV
jgi:dTDP-4-amino-4,6-dideoxygalactose transaminase